MDSTRLLLEDDYNLMKPVGKMFVVVFYFTLYHGIIDVPDLPSRARHARDRRRPIVLAICRGVAGGSGNGRLRRHRKWLGSGHHRVKMPEGKSCEPEVSNSTRNVNV